MRKVILTAFALMCCWFVSAAAYDGPEPIVVLETSEGSVYLRLFPDDAPKAVENFIGLVRKHYYDGTIFHRVIKGFMIQGGDPGGSGKGGMSFWGGTFEDEVSPNLAFDRPGLLAMANSGPNTNASQFFITTAPAPWLNLKHTIFGEVISGDDTVRAIENTDVTKRENKPKRSIRIIRAYVEGDMEADTY